MCNFLHTGCCLPAQLFCPDPGGLRQIGHAIINLMLRQVFHVFLGLPQDQGNSSGGGAQFRGALFQSRSLSAPGIKQSIRERGRIGIKIGDV
jgi:hypothetical protein